jgi:hypothetical protein
MSNRTLQALGEPDLAIAGWKMWIVGRDDEGWFHVWSVCEAPGARVKVDGALVYAAGIAAFLKQLRNVWEHIEGTAVLDCLEPNISADVSIGQRGYGELVVRMTPDHLTQKHEFNFEIDQSYLPDLIRSLEKLLEYPVNRKA